MCISTLLAKQLFGFAVVILPMVHAQVFGTSFTDALSLSRHAQWIDRSFILEKLHPAEALV